MDVISVTCSTCDFVIKAPADKAGKRGKCPKCQTPFVLPQASEKPAEAAEATIPVKKWDEDEGPQSYDVIVEDRVAEAKKKREAEIAERKRKQEAKGKKGPKLKRKFNALPDAEQWDQARTGLALLYFGAVVGAIAHILRGVWIVLGNVENPEFARHILGQINPNQGLIPIVDNFWGVNRLDFYVGMVTGPTFATLGKVMVIVCAVLFFVQMLLWVIGYFVSLAVPDRFGMKGQLVSSIVIAGLNMINMLVLHLLPILGVFSFFLISLSVPEVAITEYNMDRVLPISVMYSGRPFLENLATLFVQFFLYLQPTLIGTYLRSVGKSIRDKQTEERGVTLTQLALGTYFALMSFHLLVLCGCSPVLIIVLRVFYIVWFGFHMMLVFSTMGAIQRARRVLKEKINPEGVSLEEEDEKEERKPKKRRRRDEDDDDDDDDD